jgi:hypothetical protein
MGLLLKRVARVMLPYLTTAEAAVYLRYNGTSAVRTLMMRGLLPCRAVQPEQRRHSARAPRGVQWIEDP